MTQESDVDSTVRLRIRSLRQAHGWSLDSLAARAHLSPSTLSRIETGHRRISLDQLTSLARALGISLDQLVETVNDEDVVIRPERDEERGLITWLLNRGPGPAGIKVAKMRITEEAQGPGVDQLGVHPGKDWFTVLSGTVTLILGERAIRVETGQAAEFSTMIPHAIKALGGPAEVLVILDQDGQRTHLHPQHPPHLPHPPHHPSA
jgi:transcriptional regulator with XRE-family HTH domain